MTLIAKRVRHCVGTEQVTTQNLQCAANVGETTARPCIYSPGNFLPFPAGPIFRSPWPTRGHEGTALVAFLSFSRHLVSRAKGR